MINKAVGTGFAAEITEQQIRDELNTVTTGLIDRLVTGPTGAAATGGRTVMKAACGAVLGSGATLIQ
jgi:hypothetical protein